MKVFKLIGLSDNYEETGNVWYFRKKVNIIQDSRFSNLNIRLLDATKDSYRKKYNSYSDKERSSKIEPRTHNKGFKLEVIKCDPNEDYIFEDDNIEIEEKEVHINVRKYAPRTFKNNNNLRLAILSGDKHFCYQDKDAIDIMLQVCEDYKDFIDEFIDGGDGINNDALGKFPSTEEKRYTLYDEMVSFEAHLKEVKSIIPKAKFIIVEDNHYHLRKERFLAENPAMRGMLKDIDFPFDVKMPHGSPYHPFGQNRIGVIHGLKTNDNFTKGHSTLFKEDIINFHTHSSQHYTCKNGSKILNKQAQKMWGAPSMCKQMAYMNGSPSRSNTGFIMLWYDLESDNYNLNYVYVEDGVAVLNGKVYKSRVLGDDDNDI